MNGPLASVIISNYNYARFLSEAVDSALNQDYLRTEVIVVDDGSTDNSREVIARYGGRIVAVLSEENRGQAAALNAGYRRSRGDIILFLDSDDSLFSTAVSKAVEVLSDGETVKAHWQLHVVNERGDRTGRLAPKLPLSEGWLHDEIRTGGPWCVATPPTSCNAWTRRFLDQVMPVPAQSYRICADSYLVALGWISGPTRIVRPPQGLYREHGQNNYTSRPLIKKIRRDMEVFDLLRELLADHFSRQGVAIDPETWKRQSWPHQLFWSAQELAAIIPAGKTFILVDDDNWGGQVCPESRQLPFLEKDGRYWGPPADDETALSELERLRKGQGAEFLVFGWPAFWWLDYYKKFAAHLHAHFRCALSNERLVVFDLGAKSP